METIAEVCETTEVATASPITFWVDTETTGLSPELQDVIQIALLVEQGDTIIEEVNLLCRPYRFDTIHPRALEVNGRTVEELQSFADPVDVLAQFIAVLDRYRGADKVMFAGYNTSFDVNMLVAWFKKGGRNPNDYLDYHNFDVMSLWKHFSKSYGWKTANNKLVTIAAFFDIVFDAHEAMADIKATREVYKHLIAVQESKEGAL